MPLLSHIATSVPTLNGYADRLDSIDDNGCVSVPQEPGLGVQYDWTALEKYRSNENIIE